MESLGLPRTLKSLESIEPFAYTGVRLADVHKTGMGSSASLITSLVSGLLIHTKTIPAASFSDVDTDGRRLAHNLAQYVHCLAQGKVGSGFDVSAAVFGSHLYTRFDPDVIKDLMNDDDDTVFPTNPFSPYFSIDATYLAVGSAPCFVSDEQGLELSH